MLLAAEPTLTDLVDMVEGRRRLVEATREASRWRQPLKRRRVKIERPAVTK